VFVMETTTTTSTLPMAEVPAETKKRISKDEAERCPEWESKFVEYGLPVKLFSYIAWRESRCKPDAHNTKLNRNGSQDLGLLQVNSSWKTVTKNICGTSIDGLFNVDCNLKVSRYLYDNGGAGHWSM
jgi:soluble lytic murein transglycosylase-like protein